MSEETKTTKATASKKEPVKFFFPKNAKKSYSTADFRVKADNNLYIIDPSDKKYNDIVKFLRNHKDNGTVYVELTNGTEEETDRGKLLERLIEMECKQLRKLCGGDIELELIKSKGQLIDLYLKEQDM